MKTHVTKMTVLCNNCGNWINVKEFNHRDSICKIEKPISSIELDEELRSMVPNSW